jgi:hypothetical protein
MCKVICKKQEKGGSDEIEPYRLNKKRKKQNLCGTPQTKKDKILK